MLKPKKKKLPKCKNPDCKREFQPWSTTQKACSLDCAKVVGRREHEARKKREAREWRAETRRRKEKIKSRTDWLREAQAVFNRFIKLRDKGGSCISCGKPQGIDEGYIGCSGWHAGHYRTTKAAPHLRFDERQVHLQCATCNTHLSGNIGEYRIGLIKKIGIEAVEAIENDNRIHRYTVDEAKAIKAKYKQRLKELRE